MKDIELWLHIYTSLRTITCTCIHAPCVCSSLSSFDILYTVSSPQPCPQSQCQLWPPHQTIQQAATSLSSASVYYVAWYKNCTLLYEEDLAARSILMRLPQGITVDSDFKLMTSNVNIDGAAFDDSGNYTCAVTCGAKGVELGMIAGNLQDTTEVFVYGK